MIIDPLTCFAAIKSGMSLLERGIKAGKDLHELAGPIKKWASNEAHLETHANQKGRTGVLGKLTGAEQNAMDAFIRKQELETMRNNMREMFLLYLDNGLSKWEMLQKEIAHQRAMQKQLIKEAQERKRRFKNRLFMLLGVVIAVVVIGFEIYILKEKL
jgi:hypothetical protein|tara:strand:- start:3528 stop:4001 length:474 start_codon:yes stop_codon:yes gene_type:complete